MHRQALVPCRSCGDGQQPRESREHGGRAARLDHHAHKHWEEGRSRLGEAARGQQRGADPLCVGEVWCGTLLLEIRLN